MASSARVPDPGPATPRRSLRGAALGLAPEAPLPVARLPRAVARHLAPVSRTVWVSGTLSDVRRIGRTIVRFLLRDGATALECVATGINGDRVWSQLGRAAGSAAQASAPIRDGEQVVVRGALGLEGRRVALQFSVLELQRAGPEPVEPERERVRRVLEREGLLDPRRKRRLPRVPRRVALIAGPSTAGHLDVLSVAQARHPGIPIELVPAQMQGEGAARSIMRALERARVLPECDVIIIARGGGAAADLSVFDDEQLVRAIAGSPIPTVTGIGHETDTSLADCVADVRAATPTATAMVVVPVRTEIVAEVERLRSRLTGAMAARLERERRRLAGFGPALANGVRLRTAASRRTLERLERDLRDAPQRRLAADRVALDRLGLRLRQHVRDALARRRAEHDRLDVRLRDHLRERLVHPRAQLDRLSAQLAALDPTAILSRGYAIAFGPGGEVLGDVRSFTVGEQVVLRVRDGEVEVRVVAGRSQ